MITRPGNRVARISPLVPGVDLVGTVTASDDPTVASGSEVIVHGYDLGVAQHGGFAEFARVPASWVVPLPEGLTARQAAIVGTAGFTAALSLDRLEASGIRADDGPVLVTGASGGVGSMAVLLCAARGYEVVASTGKTAEREYLLGLGASEVIGRDDARRRRRTDPRSRAVGRRGRLRGWRHPRRGAPGHPLRRRGGGERAHRGEHPRDVRLPVHRPQRLVDRGRHRPDPDRGAARRLERDRGPLPAASARGDGRTGGRSRRPRTGARARSSTARCGAGSWSRRRADAVAASREPLRKAAPSIRCADWPAAKTGETTSVPRPHGAREADDRQMVEGVGRGDLERGRGRAGSSRCRPGRRSSRC